jgi:hypothetical protein
MCVRLMYSDCVYTSQTTREPERVMPRSSIEGFISHLPDSLHVTNSDSLRLGSGFGGCIGCDNPGRIIYKLRNFQISFRTTL